MDYSLFNIKITTKSKMLTCKYLLFNKHSKIKLKSCFITTQFLCM